MSIRTRHDNQDSISKALNKVPDRLHYGTNARTLDFVIAKKSLWLDRKQDTENKGRNPWLRCESKRHTRYILG
jgi:hypothetical protein